MPADFKRDSFILKITVIKARRINDNFGFK